MIYIAFEKCENTPASQHEAGVALRNKLFKLFDITDEAKKRKSGKPYIDDPKYHFSISHSKNIAVCAIRCRDENYSLPDNIFTIFENGEGEIGIDIETVPSHDELEKKNKIAKRFLNTSFDTVNEFVRAWTRKEAYGKYHDIPLTEAFKADEDRNTFFSGEVEFDDVLYAISVCY